MIDPYGNVRLHLSQCDIVFSLTSEMTKEVTGLTLEQIAMLRAIFEDDYKIDPATLTTEAMRVLAYSPGE